MSRKGLTAIAAVWADAKAEVARRQAARDPLPGNGAPKAEGGWGYKAGMWPGAPADALPPDCPVVPLGRDGETYWFLDSMQQLNGVHRDKWGKKLLLDLFNARPNYLQHHWPRWAAAKKGGGAELTMNGVEVDNAVNCLMHACADIGSIEIDTRVRGRGAWRTDRGELVWHAGDALYSATRGVLKSSGPCAIDRIVYPGAAPILTPWAEPAGQDEAVNLLRLFQKWNFERPKLDPLIILGGIGCCFLGGALDWRPYLFFTGGAGVGKSTLQAALRAVLHDALIKGSNVTEASLRQFGRRDSLPIAIDEFEASEDNRKVAAVIDLARIAASGDDILRGGADHHGARFTMRSTFMFSAINPPPMGAADKSRMAMINLEPLNRTAGGQTPVIDGDTTGRIILRLLMDRWPDLNRTLANWRDALRSAGFSDRAQMTYGTLMAVAELLVGPEVMEAEGLPVTEPDRLGAALSAYTETERSDQADNWVNCLHKMFAATIDAWKDGQKPTVGNVFEQMRLTSGGFDEVMANARLQLVGLKVVRAFAPDGTEVSALAVPTSPNLGPAKILQGTEYRDGVWNSALKQAPRSVVRRDLVTDKGQPLSVVKINNAATRAQFIDLAAWDARQV
ncbi:MAG: hypothetical protein LCH61_09645 [Proteobacteria bacterium]|nr:hypothetical protein [Pseudomonadota bacterium]